jgi:outer membrane protein TolC
MADLMAEAMDQRPDLAAALAQRDSAESNIPVARAAGRPAFDIRLGNYNLLGVNITVPIFTGFSVDYGV